METCKVLNPLGAVEVMEWDLFKLTMQEAKEEKGGGRAIVVLYIVHGLHGSERRNDRGCDTQ